MSAVLVIGIYLYNECHTKFFNNVSQNCLIKACFVLALALSVQNCIDQFQLLDEINNLKEVTRISFQQVTRQRFEQGTIKRFKQGTSFSSINAAKGSINFGYNGEAQVTNSQYIHKNKKGWGSYSKFFQSRKVHLTWSRQKSDTGLSRNAEVLKEMVKKD